ncbi:sulfite oxidase [Wenjunlia tyrosinilytica]|uniref:Sulfite oxidase n=1 Tax=Wenjunlia tyrosinilytica TaxID=1544741 RepID=A0A917ZYI4_9ACTN|nr:sulfite oxidase [Wenjunlia tyrosinilytica]GGP01036.1 sulfite oxidase [Wenjunlia tyrosinilytica]
MTDISSAPDPTSEAAYDRRRLEQWLSGGARADGVTRRNMLKLLGAAGLVAVPVGAAAIADAVAAADLGIVKPLPVELFSVRGTNAETKWEALRGTGYHTPIDRFFVRNHTSTPRIDEYGWRLRVFGSGLRGGPMEFGYDELRRMPSTTFSAFIECAGNGRSFYDTQQGEPATGTAWTLGAIGMARWRGVRLAEVLRRAGVTRDAVDVMPTGLDDEYVSGRLNLGRVRRPLPIAKALDDVILAFEMNGEPLPPDHGYPVRVLVPSWIGISSIKWVGSIEVSAEPLYSPWNTDFYRLLGPAYPPAGGPVLTTQTVKSAFELPWNATVRAGDRVRLHGRSWSGSGRVRQVEVSTDGGTLWRRARLRDIPRRNGWVRWHIDWRPDRRGQVQVMARATDSTGHSQPEKSVFNSQGYLFDAVVRHPIQVV